MVDAAALLGDRSIALLLIGDGPSKKSLLQYARDRKLDNIKFVGMQPVEDMPRFFSLATASIVPLVKNELFKGARPSKVFSSLAAGVPVIFSGEGETAELIVRNHAGLVAPPEDAAALANAVRLLCDSPDLRRELGVNARRLAEAEFNWDSIIGRWMDQLVAAGGN